MKKPSEMNQEELLAAMASMKDPVVVEFGLRMTRSDKVRETVLASEFIRVTDGLQKAVMSTTAFKDSSPELVAAMFAYHTARVKIFEIAEGKEST